MSGSLRLLGPVVLDRGNGVVVRLPSKQAAILARLALADGRLVTTDALVDAVWGDDATEGVLNSLRVHVSAIRKALEAAIGPSGADWSLLSVGGSYQLVLPDGYVDAKRLEALVRAADVALMRGRYGEADELAGQALDLWRGSPLEAILGAPFAAAQAQRLDQLLLTATELWADSNMALGRHAHVLPKLREVTARHPFSEPLARRLMLAAYRGGDQAGALRVFDQLQSLLAEELGVDPSPEVAALHLAILRQDSNLLVGAVAEVVEDDAGKAAAAAARALPWYGNALFGRDAELDAVEQQLRDGRSRMVTLMGAGGAGKSRLAVEVGRRVADAYPGGVALIDCAVLDGPDDLLDRCARALGAAAAADPLEALVSAIDQRRTLLILDSVERLGGGARVPLSAALAACAALDVLVTSRSAVGLDSESRYALRSLTLPEAVSLFEARARNLVPGFAPDEVAHGLVSQICERLDRLPLAIELAAARLTLMPLRVLSEHLVTEALSLSTSATTGGATGARTGVTLRETVQWSFSLLPAPTASALARLAVFDGGFTIDAAQAVLGEDIGSTLDLLGDLVGSSLVVGPSAEDTLTSQRAPRFRLLNTIRDFALAQLSGADHDHVRRDIGRYFASLFPDADRACLVIEPVVDLLEADIANLRLALTWLSAHEPVHAAHLLVATSRALTLLGESGLVAEFARLLREDDTLPAVPAAQLGSILGVCLYQVDRDAEALELHRSCLPVLTAAGDTSYPAVAAAAFLVSGLADLGHHTELPDACDAAIELGHATGEPRWLSLILDGVSYAARVSGDRQRSLGAARAALEIALSTGDGSAVTMCRESLVRALLACDRLPEALAESRLAVEAGHHASQPRYLYYAISAQARVYQAMGRQAEAAATFVTALRGFARSRVAAPDLGWAAATLADDHPVEAALLLGAAIAAEAPPPAGPLHDALEKLREEHATEVQRGAAERWPAISTRMASLLTPDP